MNSTNCADHQTLYTLQILLEWGTAPYTSWQSKQPINGYLDEYFRWKVEDANGSIIYGNDQYKLYESPKNETFCLDTYSCYEISIEQQYLYSYMSEAEVKMFAGDELLTEIVGDKDYINWNNNIDHVEYTCPIPTMSPTEPPSYNYQQSTNPSGGIIIAAIMLALLFYGLLWTNCWEPAPRQHDDQSQESTQDQNNDNNLTEERKNDKRLRILNSIITKVR